MINDLKVFAIIPARGGSKRLPRKNLLPLANKPLISWTIDSAKKSKYIDHIFVSTDDKEIAQISLDYGIEIPELRPSKLALDTSSTDDVITYTIEKYAAGYDIILLLQPTSPLRTTKNIDDALELFVSKNANSVISVTPCEHSPLWANTLPSDLSMDNFLKGNATARSQDLDNYYRLNGAIYILDLGIYKKNKEIKYDNNTFAYVMENINSIDIDNLYDFKLAEFLIKSN
ncbi:cytidylyltransferase domain-containing protein [Morganella morganii]